MLLKKTVVITLIINNKFNTFNVILMSMFLFDLQFYESDKANLILIDVIID